MALTGNGTTIAFGTSGFTANIYSIGGSTQTREALETTYLGTSGFKEFIPDSLVDGGETEIEFEWNPSFSTFPPISAAAETITITFPLASGQITNATLAGTGFLTAATSGTATNGEIMRGTATIKWDGNTGPTYTAGS